MTDLKPIIEEAADAFWAVIVKHFPQATTGDLSPLTTFQFGEAAENAVEEWVWANATTKHAEIKTGYRFELFREIHRFPDFKAKVGLLGTVTKVDESGVWGRMDEVIPGAEQWDNQINWDDADDFASQTLPVLQRQAQPWHDLFTHLDASHIRLEEFGCFVALSDDRDTIFDCPMMADGSPDRDGLHMNWGQVTAPEPEFVDKINELYGTAFKYENFAGR